MNVEQHERSTPAEAMIAFHLVETLPVKDQLAFAITLLATLGEENRNNPDLKECGYVHTGCAVSNAINFLHALTLEHQQRCPYAQKTEIPA